MNAIRKTSRVRSVSKCNDAVKVKSLIMCDDAVRSVSKCDDAAVRE